MSGINCRGTKCRGIMCHQTLYYKRMRHILIGEANANQSCLEVNQLYMEGL